MRQNQQFIEMSPSCCIKYEKVITLSGCTSISGQSNIAEVPKMEGISCRKCNKLIITSSINIQPPLSNKI